MKKIDTTEWAKELMGLNREDRRLFAKRAKLGIKIPGTNIPHGRKKP